MRPPIPGLAGSPALEELVEALAARFEEWEGEVCAFVPEDGRFVRLRREARNLLRRFPDAKSRPALFGLPVGIKDVFHADGFPTRGGSRLPPEELAGREAECVTELKEAGALVVGKTVTTEFAYFAPGPTRNPHNLEHTPGGSSSGSAAAVAAGLAELAVGTQTIGSITRPAAYCGVVGFKPSYDRISRTGLIPLAPSLDHVGLLAPDVATARRGAEILCRRWRGVVPGGRPLLAVPEGPYLERAASAEEPGHFEEVCRRLQGAGWRIVRLRAFPDFTEVERRHRLIVEAEAARVHARWFDRFRELYDARTVELVERGRKVSGEALSQALAGRESLRRSLTEQMDRHRVDLWISPAATGAAPRGLESTGDPVMSLPWTHSGLPTLQLPAGESAEGLPLGLQLAARGYADEALFAWAGELEAVVAGRVAEEGAE